MKYVACLILCKKPHHLTEGFISNTRLMLWSKFGIKHVIMWFSSAFRWSSIYCYTNSCHYRQRFLRFHNFTIISSANIYLFKINRENWWILETLRSSTFCLRIPHRCLMGFRSGDMLGQSITFTLRFFSKAVVVVMLEYCPAAQSPKWGDHSLLQYVTVHVGIHGSLNEL